ncbi:MAG TPA: hypothetical protein VFG71_13020 [Nitrospiraceae bacterium]|nr:hypothetical protein [Nitrospiraceae bacterium]
MVKFQENGQHSRTFRMAGAPGESAQEPAVELETGVTAGWEDEGSAQEESDEVESVPVQSDLTEPPFGPDSCLGRSR